MLKNNKNQQLQQQQQQLLGDKKIHSPEHFEVNWLCWRLLGVVPPPSRPTVQDTNKRIAYFIWSVIINAVATISCPIHLMLSIFDSEQSQAERFQNVAIYMTSIGVSSKFLLFFIKLNKIKKMEMWLSVMDSRVQHPEERVYYENDIRGNLKQLKYLFQVTYLVIGSTAMLSFLMSPELRLFYPGWLPFDWRKSHLNYAYAISYQFVIVFFQLVQNFASDYFSSKALCLLSGHIQMLYMRVARIGYDQEISPREHENELNRCVVDQMHLYELFDVIEDIISWPTLLQFLVSVVNTCVALVALLYFVDNIFEQIYYVCYIIGIIGMEVFPTCYYGSDFKMLFEKLHYAIFSSNWTKQSKSFKRSMMIFTERSLRPTEAMAGGMVRIHLDTFFAVCKTTYSLFAVVLTMKK